MIIPPSSSSTIRWYTTVLPRKSRLSRRSRSRYTLSNQPFPIGGSVRVRVPRMGMSGTVSAALLNTKFERTSTSASELSVESTVKVTPFDHSTPLPSLPFSMSSVWYTTVNGFPISPSSSCSVVNMSAHLPVKSGLDPVSLAAMALSSASSSINPSISANAASLCTVGDTWVHEEGWCVTRGAERGADTWLSLPPSPARAASPIAFLSRWRRMRPAAPVSSHPTSPPPRRHHHRPSGGSRTRP
mmetsp:Transcript_94668/g.270896  ORF Transcript_94668/g.270896 Transcript_94668/m.270896 type:complete len:243 (+) Transcript_94668:32-760(+)